MRLVPFQQLAIPIQHYHNTPITEGNVFRLTHTMSQDINSESKEQSIQLTKRVLFILGSIFVVVGIVRQWPILGKTYMEFIEGQGYLSLMLGLIMIVLGFSVPLLMGDEEDS